MRGIECAFQGSVAKTAELRVAKTGRSWLSLQVEVGEGEEIQRVTVAAFFGDIDILAPLLLLGTRVYIEGSIRLRKWINADGAEFNFLNVSASKIEPLGLIGEKKPKKPKAERTQKSKPEAASADPVPFSDPLPF